jgi:hypothetical protein
MAIWKNNSHTSPGTGAADAVDGNIPEEGGTNLDQHKPHLQGAEGLAVGIPKCCRNRRRTSDADPVDETGHEQRGLDDTSSLDKPSRKQAKSGTKLFVSGMIRA